MKTLASLRTLTLAGAALAVGLPGLASGQNSSEMEALESKVKVMEQTILDLNHRLAEIEKQSPAAVPAPTPAQPAPPLTTTTPSVPPATHPGADVKPKAQPSPGDLADDISLLTFWR